MQDDHHSPPPEGQSLPVPQDRHPTAHVEPGSRNALALPREGSGDDADTIDLRHYWHILLRRKWTVLSTLGIVFCAVLVGSLLNTPIYRATATIQIDRDAVKVVEGQGNDSDAYYDAENFYNTQYELLRSEALSQRVAAELKLAKDPAYLALQKASLGGKIKGLLGAASTAKDKPGASASATDSDSADLADYVNGNLDIQPVRNTRLVQINFDSASPALAAKIANSLADNFIAQNLEHSYNASAYARKYLEGRLAQLKQKLADSEAELVKIATSEQLVVGADGKTTLPAVDLSNLASSLADAQTARSLAEARWKLASTTPGDALPADMFTNSIIGTLRQSRAQLAADYQNKLNTYQPNYPLMVSMKQQMDELDRQIQKEYANVKASTKSSYEAAVQHENLLRQQMDTVKQQMFGEQHRAIAYNVLVRDVNTNQALYDALLERYKTIGIAGGVANNNIAVIDRADMPIGPYKPNIKLNLLVAIVFGLGLGVGLALLFEMLDDTLKSPADVEAHLRLAVLGVVPKLKNVAPHEAFKDTKSAFSEAYRSVRTALQFSTGSGVPRSLLVTSAMPGDGKTTTSLALARNFAQLGKRVLLIDADLRNPSLHRQLRMDNEQGLSNVLSGAVEPQAAIHALEDEPGLQVMTAGPLPPNPAELLAGPRMLSLLTVAMAKYDQVVIDSPPTLGLADAALLAHIAKGTVLVVNAGGTRREAAISSVKRLHAAHARLVGAVMTKYDAKQSGYGYGYGYGSYSYYSYEREPAKLERG